MADYAALADKKTELIRKGLEGSVFVGKTSAEVISAATLFGADGALQGLPTGYEDLGWTNDDGAQYSRSVDTSDITGWGSNEPLRSDITADTTTMAVVARETKALTLGISLGVDMSAVVPGPGGVVEVKKPAKASASYYRLLALAVDLGDGGEIYIARFMPRAKVTDFGDQALNNGDDGITYSFTFQGYKDSDFGSSESYLFGGPGWNAILDSMGFTAAPAPTPTPTPTPTPAPVVTP